MGLSGVEIAVYVDLLAQRTEIAHQAAKADQTDATDRATFPKHLAYNGRRERVTRAGRAKLQEACAAQASVLTSGPRCWEPKPHWGLGRDLGNDEMGMIFWHPAH